MFEKVIATGNGNVIVEYAYDSWGKPISVTVNNSIYEDVALANPLRYRGYVYDNETGLYYLQSRYYDPELCRFISADSYLVAGNALQGTNMFAYCLNNPVRYSDPSGFSPIDVGAILDIFLSFIKSLFTIKYDVPLYSQGEYSLCWAFCQVMIEEYQSAGTPISQEKAEKRAIEIAKQLHGETGWNKGGFPLNAGKAINRFDENGREQISLFKLYYLLLTQGPVYAHYWNGDGNTSSHLVVITGVSLLKGKVYSNNPWGCAGEQTYSEFLNGFLNKPNDYDAPLFSITPTI